MKSKKSLIIIITLITVFIIVDVILFINSKKVKVSIKNNRDISINEKCYNTTFIKKVKNGKIISKKKKIDTTKLGTKKITISIKNFFKKTEKYTYKINVIDKESPKIEYNDKLVTTKGTDIDLLKDVKVTDNSKEDIKVSVEGDYDINKVGSYKLYYVASDSSKNKTKSEFTLEVEEIKVKETIKDNNKQQNMSDTSSTTSKGFKVVTKNGITYVDGYLIANKTYSLPASYSPGDITSETRQNMNNMFAAAKNVGLNIYLSSGFRSYQRQSTLYNNYVARDGKSAADTYSARPGHSEHQTGLAFDVNQINSTFDDTEEAKWLANNCYKFGFILRYPKGKTNETGYMYESWHFRYVGEELARKLYNNGDWITLESYFGITSTYND